MRRALLRTCCEGNLPRLGANYRLLLSQMPPSSPYSSRQVKGGAAFGGVKPNNRYIGATWHYDGQVRWQGQAARWDT